MNGTNNWGFWKSREQTQEEEEQRYQEKIEGERIYRDEQDFVELAWSSNRTIFVLQ